jgi:hypothetical protein
MQKSSGSPTDLAYAAGVIDSDGCIAVRRSVKAGEGWQATYQPRVMLKQVTPQAVDLMESLFGGYRFVGNSTAKRGRPLFGWEVHSAAAVRVCESVLPYLRIKREQAQNAIEVGRINTSTSRRGWDLPEIDPTEPLVPLLEAARRAGRSAEVAYQSAHLANIPVVRVGRRVMMPESYIETWANRKHGAPRRAELTDALHAHYLRAKELNKVGV